MVKGQTMAIKVDEYIDKRLEEKLGSVRAYVDVKATELGAKIEKLEGQVQGLRDSYKGLENRFEGFGSEFRALGMKVDSALIQLRVQYETLYHQYEQVMVLLKIVLDRTDPEKIGFTKKKE